MAENNNIYLEFTVSGEMLERTDYNRIASGTRNYIKAKFNLIDDWIGINPVAIFSKGVKTIQVANAF